MAKLAAVAILIAYTTNAFAQTDALFIDGHGNVGIGKSDPKNSLDVHGNISLDGKIGVGKTNADHAIDVHGNIALDGTHLVYNSENAVLDWGKTSGTGAFLIRTLKKQGVLDSFVDRLVMDASGNVGIGQRGGLTNKLQLGGNLHLDGNSLFLDDGASNRNCFVRSGIPQKRLEVSGQKEVALGCSPDGPDHFLPMVHILENGRVGIRNAEPRAFLDVGGYVNDSVLGTVFGRLAEGNATGGGTYLGVRGYSTQQNIYSGKMFSLEHSFYGAINNSINFYRGGGVQGGFMTFNTSGNYERMRIDPDGRVGIGTKDPSAMLDVQGSIGRGGGTYAYFNSAGVVRSTTGGSARYASIFAGGDIVTNAEFITYSDERIKKEKKESDIQKDLATLNKLKVTDYKYIDYPTYGEDSKKGFIAQEVERAFPEAVKRGSDFVPDIFTAAAKTEQSNGIVTITLNKPHNLATNDKVRLITKTGRQDLIVKVIGTNTFSVEAEGEDYNDIFVFGKKVDDFRMLDYDRLVSLNISATQQLTKEVEQLKAENEQLKKANKKIQQSYDDVEGKLLSLEAKVDAIMNKGTVAK